jgi:hypothetical protein
MARKKIAPRLEDAVSMLREPFQAQARRELRALKACEKALRRLVRMLDACTGCNNPKCAEHGARRALDRAGKGDDRE